MSTRLKQAPQVWKLATDLGLKPKDNALADIVRMCVNQVRAYWGEFPCATLSELCDVVAAKVDTRFIEIRTDYQLQQVEKEFCDQGEIEFANLDGQLGAEVYAITFKLLRPTKLDRRFVSVIDCRGVKAWRCYFSKWHELAHLLTLTPQLRLKFCRTHSIADQKDPEEATMDIVAGAVGFLPDLVQKHATGLVSFEKISDLRAKLCPEASTQASIIGFVQNWPTPAILIQPVMALRRDQKIAASQYDFGFKAKPEPVLRAVTVSPNNAARSAGLEVFRNMRVPRRSVIYKVHHDGIDGLQAMENLDWWESSDGTRLPSRTVLVEARRFGANVHALITVVE